MKVLCFGSLNIDYTYRVERFVTEGETIRAVRMDTFCGGKGLNQSISLSRAGVDVWHAGVAGIGSGLLLDALQKDGVHLDYLKVTDQVPNGQAIIQVDDAGRNCIIVYPGSNAMITKEYVEQVLENFDRNDSIVLQNEISNLSYIVHRAREKGMQIFLNPSPITQDLTKDLLAQVDYLIINEVEGKALTGFDSFEQILDAFQRECPCMRIVLTVGKQGVLYRDGQQTLSHGSYDVEVADTTAAGDTFSGYFIAGICQGMEPAVALHNASIAGAICVSRRGAAPSIPKVAEVMEFDRIYGGRSSDSVIRHKT